MRRFVAEGAKVAFADRDVDRGKRVAAEIEASGGQPLFLEAHMEREAEAPSHAAALARVRPDSCRGVSRVPSVRGVARDATGP